jgi:hypothetical protein
VDGRRDAQARLWEIGGAVQVFALWAIGALGRLPLVAAALFFSLPPRPPNAAADRGTSGGAGRGDELSGWLIHEHKALKQTTMATGANSLDGRRQGKCVLRVSRWR